MLIPAGAPPVALGRQALALAARGARDAGRRTVLVPWYCCQTMVTPWELEGMSVRRIPVGPDLLMDAAALSHSLRDCREAGEHPVVLHCQTLGLHAGPQLAGVLARVARTGALVVDRTHSFLEDHCPHASPDASPGCDAPAGSVEIVSSRKLLPLAEVAWITGPDHRLAGRTPADEDLTAARMRYLADPRVSTFEEVEDLADSAWTPVPPDRQALDRLREFDAPALVEQMRAGREAVMAGLAVQHAGTAVEVVNPRAVCPLVVRAAGRQAADRIAEELHGQGLDGPIHWDRPAHLAPVGGSEWPDDLVCLPVVMDADQVATVLEILGRTTS
ncbi:MAG: hypothetical protein L0I04_03320 [Acidipropionibacterium jensenii]|uniref:hypothetical protein n=1 Tax=Acidipropionibacterium jensenii TaxID=1749 RepID=UPI0026476990|nr:hypothetical protein [Acidipropionibacterium jensenii]MDN5976775.1 hypothetical protein [Acidipropionibacterium jensenii]